ncbi:hypothetical protein KFE25_009049 [Diacronema lutheri]|uniref:Ribosomal RNA-processing protein 7 C-terminal domain-containing protein n=1 Tax=Diacronema lutheri TaxID=2081491 RepID=A0A8J5XM36_DIALT|nr:hypothetical protein KFE25_009049 [Diacronema lutheri]
MPGGYTRIPVATGGGVALRFVYVRPHKSKDQSTPRDRTLFVSNVPDGVEQSSIRDAWQRAYGRVVSVTRVDAAAGMPSSVLITFADASAIARALAPAEQLLALPATVQPPLLRPTRAAAFAELRDRALKAEVNEYMLKFDAAQAEMREAAADAEGVPDDDGFVTVTRAHNRLKRSEADGAAAKPPQKKNKATELQDFYHFQRHERKREHLHKLRQRFEDDKQRIAAMKAQRKFRPE